VAAGGRAVTVSGGAVDLAAVPGAVATSLAAGGCGVEDWASSAAGFVGGSARAGADVVAIASAAGSIGPGALRFIQEETAVSIDRQLGHVV
jgi:dihydroorotate dehydrogenase